MAKMIPNMCCARDRANLITRDGRAVDAVVESSRAQIWRWQITVGDKVYKVNCNGRRYANVECDDDVLRVWNYDAMPKTMEVIEAVRRGDMGVARSLNGWKVIENHLSEPGATRSIPHPSHLQ